MLILSSFGISAALIGMGGYFHLKSLEKEICGLTNSTNSASTICHSYLSNYSTVSLLVNEDSDDNCEAIYTQSLGKNLNLTVYFVKIYS